MNIQIIKKNWVTIFLVLIFFLAAFLRLYRINEIPVSLYWDEVASTYNAYSIAQTGKDEYGTPFPLLFRSFDDYKMSGNIYLTAFFVKAFGLNEFSARASSAILGTFTVLLTYFLVKELFLVGKKDHKHIFLNELPSIAIGLLSAMLLAISPWHIQFSRTGFEANVAVFFVVLGAIFFLKGIRKDYKFYLWAMVIFASSIYFYRSVHVFLPLFLVGIFLLFMKELRQMGIKKVILGAVLFCLISLPLVPWLSSYGGLARVRQVNFITETKERVYENTLKQQQRDDIIGKVIYNRRIVYARQIAENYLSHYSLQFLFFAGDGNGRHGPRGMGLLYLWELPFLVLGIVCLIKLPGKIRYLIILWIALAPIAASLSIPSPHALRSLNVLPMPQILTSFGIYFAYLGIQKRFKKIYIFCLAIIIITSFIYYLHLYYNITARSTSGDWADGYKQLVHYVSSNEESYEKVIISGHYWQPYAYFLFYKSYDPALFQEIGSPEEFDKYYFGGTGWDKDKGREELGSENLEKIAKTNNVLVALSPEEYEMQRNNINKISEITNHNNEIVFIIGELKK